MGNWKWGTKIRFFRFPRKVAPLNTSGNSAANTQMFIDLLDDVGEDDSLRISSYLRGHTGFPVFRKFVTKCLVDPRIVGVLWADLPEEAINMEPGVIPTETCRAVRTQILKMLDVGAFEWVGFTPPVVSSLKDLTTSLNVPLTPSSAVNLMEVSDSPAQQTRPLPTPLSKPPQLHKATQTTLPFDATLRPTPPVCTTTSTQTTTSNLEPIALSGTYTSKDKCKDSCVHALARIRSATPPGFHWTGVMIMVLLRFVYHAVVNLNWSWSDSCKEAGAIFKLKPHTVHRMGTLHLQTDGTSFPPELPRKTTGRGSELFKQNDVEGRFKILKDDHLKEILSYVRERNRSMAGVCTVRSIQAHLLHKFGISFKYHTVRYALTERLGLKYRNAIKKRLVFTPHRIRNTCRSIFFEVGESARRARSRQSDPRVYGRNILPPTPYAYKGMARGR